MLAFIEHSIVAINLERSRLPLRHFHYNRSATNELFAQFTLYFAANELKCSIQSRASNVSRSRQQHCIYSPLPFHRRGYHFLVQPNGSCTDTMQLHPKTDHLLSIQFPVHIYHWPSHLSVSVQTHEIHKHTHTNVHKTDVSKQKKR